MVALHQQLPLGYPATTGTGTFLSHDGVTAPGTDLLYQLVVCGEVKLLLSYPGGQSVTCLTTMPLMPPPPPIINSTGKLYEVVVLLNWILQNMGLKQCFHP